MGRMHALLQTYLTLPQSNAQSHYSSSYGGLSSGTSFSSSPTGMSEIYKRILKMQDMLLKAVTEHDTVIQEKIAELALTGDPDETEV
jgi:hypothetical protein